MSVDEFLGTRRDLVPIGKALIAISLLVYEQEGHLYRGNCNPSWLQVLSARLDAPVNEWGRNRLSIITFNYDRVVEYFLHSSLVYRFHISNDEATALLRSAVRVLHLHGQLGNFHGLGDGEPRQFGPQLTAPLIKIAAEGIRIIHEGDPESAAFVEARGLLSSAHEVVFMGFGYGVTNMSRLQLGTILHGKRVLGSSIKMNQVERAQATARAGSHLRLAVRHESLTDFLRENTVLAG